MADQNPNVQESGVQEPVPYVTAEMAWEMSKRAAAEAREEALKEAQAQAQNFSRDTQSRDTQNNRNSQNRDDDYEDRRPRKRRRRDDDDEEEEDLVGFSPKLVKQLQTTVGVFNTLKDFASNPMQKAIEDRIGGLAAGIIEQAFTSPRGPPPKRDMVDTLLNSQMAFGLGQGLGSRAPELVESLSRSFGREKAENMIEGMIGKYSGGERRKVEPDISDKSPSSEQSSPSPGPAKSEDQSNIELLLSLDPNNAEHVAAYAESQGGISIDVARKMLMIHQDDIIKRMKSQGADTTVIESQRGSRVGQDNPQHTQTSPDLQTFPVQPAQQTHPPHVQQVPPPVQQVQVPPPSPVQQTPSVPQSNMQEDMQYMEPEINRSQNPGQEYAEYKDIKQQENNSAPNISNNQQEEMIKAFAEDIGKVMGDVIGKIESLNNTVFNLQNELNDVKKQKAQPSPISLEQTLESKSSKDFLPNDFEKELDNATSIQDYPIQDYHIQDYHIQDSKIAKRAEEPLEEKIQERTGFFHEKVQNIHDFEKELEEETKRAIQLTRKVDTNEPPKVDITEPKVDITEPKVDIIAPKVDTRNKEIAIIKKPIMSMVNKKKISYSLKQKEDNIQSEINVGNDNTQPEIVDNTQPEINVDNNNEDNNNIKSNEINNEYNNNIKSNEINNEDNNNIKSNEIKNEEQ